MDAQIVQRVEFFYPAQGIRTVALNRNEVLFHDVAPFGSFKPSGHSFYERFSQPQMGINP